MLWIATGVVGAATPLLALLLTDWEGDERRSRRSGRRWISRSRPARARLQLVAERTLLNESAPALADPFSTSLAGRRLGRYEVLARLASGGMAAVYVARAQGVAGFERLVAIKVLHPHLAHEQEFITMFLDEARLAARIRHPNVVPTIDISDTQDAGYYLVMEYIEGDHLGALLQQAYEAGTRLPPPVALRIIVDALAGLAAAHDADRRERAPLNLVHRDVSPHNVMVGTDGVARITDFGVAKAEVRLSTTREGQFKGKLAYMAPEHASTGEADQRSDLFSMGIILWECLTGARLFRAENQAATLHKICIEPIPLPSSVDPALGAVRRGAGARRWRAIPTSASRPPRSSPRRSRSTRHTLGGLANQRAVAKLVREYAAEKIERDRELIRSAIAEIGLNAEHAEPEVRRRHAHSSMTRRSRGQLRRASERAAAADRDAAAGDASRAEAPRRGRSGSSRAAGDGRVGLGAARCCCASEPERGDAARR